jgi:TolB-like protein
MTTGPKLAVRVFGPFSASWSDGAPLEVRAAKAQALLAVLATAPDGLRTRQWLQETLWGRSGPELGRASLRQALRALRQIMGLRFETLFDVANSSIRLRPGSFEVLGTPADGPPLEGVDFAEPGFEDWRRVLMRAAPGRADPAVPAPPAILPVLPTLAVLPLRTPGGDRATEQLGDAISQEITRALSRSQLIGVISHLSCCDPSMRDAGLSALRSAMGVDHVAAGTIRTEGDRVIVDIDLADAGSGRVLWTERFEGCVAEFLRGEGPLAFDIAARIGRSIVNAAVELAATRPMPAVDAHALLLSGIALMHRQSQRSFALAREHLEEVARRAPRHPIPLAWLGNWHILSVIQGWSDDLDGDRTRARELTARALDIHPDCPVSLTIDGFVHNNLLKRLDEAGARYDEALEIEPNNALAWLLKGTLMAFVDRGAEAVAYTARARALSPLDPYGYFFDSLSATASASAGDWPEALRLAERSLAANRRHASTLRVRTAALQMLGREAEARVAAEELLRADPGFTIDGYMRTHPAAEYRTGREWARALQGAGVPMN